MPGTGAALGVLEQAMRAALTSSGAVLLEAVLTGEDGYCGPHAWCGCGGQAAYAGRRDKTVTTVPGPVRLTRAWYHCAACHHGFAPRDQQLGVAGSSLSSGLAEMAALAGAEVSFARAAGLLAGLAGITVSPRTIERSAEASGAAARAAATAEATAITARRVVPLPPPEPVPDMLYVETGGTGVPMRASETTGRQGKSEDGKAGTREVKLARLFTVSRLDDDGRPVMDVGSSTYAATFDGKNALAGLVKGEYLRRGGEHFRQVAALGDGAAWIWTMAEDLYPHATHIVDIYHAREHLTDLAAHLAFITPDPAQWLEDRNADLDDGDIEAIITAARAYPLDGVKAGELDRKLGYFERNARRMRYQHFRDLGMFIGSGAIEGGIKAIVCQRAKQSGMHWTTEGAASIIALRCQRPVGRAMARSSHPGRTARRHLTDTATQTRMQQPEQDHPQQSCRAPPIRVAWLECQTVGVKWPTVTRPADSMNDQILPAASRSCVCGHLVYDDQEPRCALCACRDHRPRPSAAREQGSPFPAWHRGQAGAS
ncbi:MAG: ISKra4 family transposase [Streptosporangiaceae bacterium]